MLLQANISCLLMEGVITKYVELWSDVPPVFHNPSSFQLQINQEVVDW